MEDTRKHRDGLRKLNQFFRLLCLCNQALLQPHDEAELLAKICELVVNTGGYLTAWIGMPQQDAGKSIRVVASHGYSAGFLENLKLTWGDTEQVPSPTEAAIKTQVVQVNHNLQNNPAVAPWYEEASKRGYQSSIALPLIINGSVLGALSIYSSNPEAFIPEEIEFLANLATNLAYGIQMLRLRAHVKAIETQCRLAIDTSPDGFWIVSPDGHLTDVNDTYIRMSGYGREELIGMSIAHLDAHEDEVAVASRIETIISKGGTVRFETEHRKKDGTIWPVLVTTSVVPVHGGGFLSYLKDLTERKESEFKLRNARETTYRDVLIREVHHRIKNNLQGVIGTLSMSVSTYPQLAEIIQPVIGQVRTIAALHGLQGSASDGEVGLCELAKNITENVEITWRMKIAFHIPEPWRVYFMAESEAVPVALILNELLANAVKHCRPGGSVGVRLLRDAEQHRVTVFIDNDGTIPQGFGLHMPDLLGTGLQLVSALMPPAGASLHWEQDKDRVVTVFQLDEPNIRPSTTYFSQNHYEQQK